VNISVSFLSALAGALTSISTIVCFGASFKKWLFKELVSDIKSLKLATKRNELLLLFNSNPDNVEVLERVYDEYIELGGNSYISNLHTEWQRKYARGVFKSI